MKKPFEYPRREIGAFRELLDEIGSRYSENIAFLWRDLSSEDGIAVRTYADLIDDVKSLAAYLCAMGLQGRRIALCGKNSYLWVVSYLAVCCGCGTVVPLDRELCAESIADLMNDAECAAVLFGDDVQSKLDAAQLPSLLKLPLSQADTYLAQGKALCEAGSRSYELYSADPDAPGVILYTSGTVGIAKAVMLSQRNICANIVGICRRFQIREDDRALSHLPLHLAYECTTLLAMLFCGAGIAFSDSTRRLPADLSLFRPTLLVTVPAMLEFIARFIEKSYAEARGGKILFRAQRAATGVVSNAIGVVSKKTAEKSRRSIFSTVHSFMGGRLRAVIVGAAPLNPDIFRKIEQFGYAVYAGYGLTECAPVVFMHNDRYRNAEDVGYPVLGTEVRIDEPDASGIGILCVKGLSVMLGYLNNEEATAEVLSDGWLRTSDLVQQTPSGAYRIVGRASSVIVLPTGKKVYPEELEALCMKHPLVSECLVYADMQDGEQTLCAAVYPDIDVLIQKLDLPTDTDLTVLDEAHTACAKELLLDIVRSVNAQMPQYRHIRRLVIRKTEFTKTASRKIKRGAPENAVTDADSAANT